MAAIRPLPESARQGQSGTGRERDASAPTADRRAEARALRPGEANTALATQARSATNNANSADTSAAAARSAPEQTERERAAQQQAEQARWQERQQLLTNVWQASAAVVERALGLGDAAASNPATERTPAAGSQPLEQLALPWPVLPEAARSNPARAAFPEPQAVVAYDERGNSNLAPLAMGSLISRRI